MPSDSPTAAPVVFAAFVGLDWGDCQHAVCLLEEQRLEPSALKHAPEEVHAWAEALRARFGGRPVAVALEQSRGALIQALLGHDHLVLFPLNPQQAACYRRALAVSGKKDDPSDAALLARFVREHHEQLRPLRPDDPCTRELGELVELRRNLVEARRRVGQQLVSALKQHFPQVLEFGRKPHHPLVLELLRRWPTLLELQRANPRTLERFFRSHRLRPEGGFPALLATLRGWTPWTRDRALLGPKALYVQALVRQLAALNDDIQQFQRRIEEVFARHQDAPLFRALPGAGAALAPRLLAALGSDRQRFASAAELQAYSGIAPVTQRSGKSCQVRRRYACPKFLRQTFHEFAGEARKWSGWSRAYYRHLRARGQCHQAALRALAFKWIRILYRLWQDRTLYDERRYQHQLRAKKVPYLPLLENP
jgi:transposase